MGCIGYCVVGFISFLVLAIIMSVVEWFLYNSWWIILSIIACVVIVTIIRRPQILDRWKLRLKGGNKAVNPPVAISFEQLIKAAAADGVISAKEKQAIINKGVAAGMEPEEAEIMMESKMHELGVTYAKKRTTKKE